MHMDSETSSRSGCSPPTTPRWRACSIEAGVDALLVGDSLGNVVLGLDTTLPVTLDEMVHHTRPSPAAPSARFVIGDMPFLTYQVSVAEAVRNAVRLLKEGGAAAVKLEGGAPSLTSSRGWSTSASR